MAIWGPFADLDELRRELERTLQDAWAERPRAWRGAFLPGRAARQYPLVNVSEDPANVYVEGLAPGVEPKSLDLTVIQGSLVIRGEKPGLAQVTAEAYHRNERAAGRFVRSIELPAEVDAARIRAEYRNGLLLITLPKSEAAKPRKIEVSVA